MPETPPSIAEALKALITDASPEARSIVSETLRLEKEKAHMLQPRNIIPELSRAVSNVVKDDV